MESSSTVEQYSEFLDQAQRHQIIFYYVGYFSQTIIASMAEAMKLQLQVADVSGPTRRKLFSLFVEMTQNIIHYSSDALTPASQNNGELRHGSVCIKKEGDGRFLLLCANPIKNDVVDRLRPKLDALRNMTVEEIKQAYKETLLAETPEDSKGAGVGFLTMARDAREPLEFLFQPLDGTEDMTMFYLKAVI
jgi:hypothetical protein